MAFSSEGELATIDQSVATGDRLSLLKGKCRYKLLDSILILAQFHRG